MHGLPRPQRRVLLLASLAALVVSGGCGPVAAPTVPPAPAAPGSAPETAGVDLKVVKLDQLEAAIAAHKGKVVLLDVWSVT
jgi:hypothetical protein